MDCDRHGVFYRSVDSSSSVKTHREAFQKIRCYPIWGIGIPYSAAFLGVVLRGEDFILVFAFLASPGFRMAPWLLNPR